MLVEKYWVKKSWVQIFVVEKFGVEKSGVEMSCNPYFVASNLRKREENLPLQISMLYLWAC